MSKLFIVSLLFFVVILGALYDTFVQPDVNYIVRWVSFIIFLAIVVLLYFRSSYSLIYKDSKIYVFEFSKKIIYEANNVSKITITPSSYLWMMGPYSAEHKGTLARLEYLVHKQFMRFESLSAIQTIMLGAYVSVAHTDEALNQLRDLLTDKSGGLSLDSNLRWAILMRLNQFAFKDYIELTNNESVRDKSNMGEHMALLCEAGRPDGNIKHKWLEEILNPNSSYKPILLSKMTRALFPASQKELFGNYQNRVIDSLPAVLARNDDFLLANYTSNLMPRSCSAASITRLMDINKQHGELSSVLHKNLAVLIEDDRRCMNMAIKMNFKYTTEE